MITEPFEGARMEGVTGFFQGTSHKDGTEGGNEGVCPPDILQGVNPSPSPESYF